MSRPDAGAFKAYQADAMENLRARLLPLRYKGVSATFLVLSLIYVLQSLLESPGPRTLHKYSITADQARLLVLSVIIPYIVIWLVALAGYLRLRAYGDLITGSKDGQAFTTIAWGVLCLAVWLPLSAVASNFFSNLYAGHPSETAALTIIDNYFNIVILIPAFLLIDRGAKKLVSLTRATKRAPGQRLILGYLVFSVLYTWLVLSDPTRRVPTAAAPLAAYYQPDWLIVTTIIIPRLLMWFLGVQAVQNLYFYAHKIRGRLYKEALQRLAFGLGGVTITVVVLRCLQSLSVELDRLSLGLVLLLLYALLILMSVGYVLIAKGANKLRHIEEV